MYSSCPLLSQALFVQEKHFFQHADHLQARDTNAPEGFELAYFISETSALTSRSQSFVTQH